MTISSDLYAEVLHFYADQMQRLDNRDFTGYANTFTKDGEFQHSPTLPAVYTRDGISETLVEFHQQRFAGQQIRRRHWFGHVALTEQEDGSIAATSYCLVLTIRADVKEPEVGPSCVVNDVLVRDEPGNLLMRSRRISHDQLFD
jgi:actinorhodin biosynthesis protein ActVIA